LAERAVGIVLIGGVEGQILGPIKLGVRRDAVTDRIASKVAKAHHIGHPGKRLGLDLGLDDRVARTQARRSRRQFGLLGRRIAQGDFGIEPAQNAEDLRLLDAVEEVLAPGRQCWAISIPISAPRRLWNVQACVPLARLALRLWLTA
jgi:hypothetical protein